MNWTSLGKSGKLPVDIAYQYHKPDSNCLVVYNLTNKTLRQVDVVIICKSGKHYSITINDLLKKTGELIRLSVFNEESLNCSLINQVEIKNSGIKCTFIPDQNKFKPK